MPVTTGEKVKAAVAAELQKRNSDLTFDVASNPEFLKEGAAIEDFLKPDRIVVGVESAKAEETMKKLYKPFTVNGHPIFVMDIPSAEMTKYAANSMLATKISFMNDIANLCEIVGADVNMVRKGIGSDTRIGNKFIYPGIGYGGSCFPKDVKALIKTAQDNNYDLQVLKAVEAVNEKQKSILFDKVMKHYNNQINGLKLAVWGLSFKPKTDDMREAPSVVIIEKLLQHRANVVAYDPVAAEECRKHHLGDRIAYVEDPYIALENADALLIITEWPEFRNPDMNMIISKMKSKVIFDGRNIYDSAEMKEAGFTYYCIGIK